MPLPPSPSSTDSVMTPPVICAGASDANNLSKEEESMHELMDLIARVTPIMLAEERTAAATNELEAKLLIQSINVVRPLLAHVTRPIESEWVGESSDGLTGYEEATNFPEAGRAQRKSL
jgi:hypothetical protein